MLYKCYTDNTSDNTSFELSSVNVCQVKSGILLWRVIQNYCQLSSLPPINLKLTSFSKSQKELWWCKSNYYQLNWHFYVLQPTIKDICWWLYLSFIDNDCFACDVIWKREKWLSTWLLLFGAWYHGNLFRSCIKRLVEIPRQIAHYHPTLRKPQRLIFFTQESSSTHRFSVQHHRIWGRFCRNQVQLKSCALNLIPVQKGEPPWLPYTWHNWWITHVLVSANIISCGKYRGLMMMARMLQQ